MCGVCLLLLYLEAFEGGEADTEALAFLEGSIVDRGSIVDI